MGEGYAFGDHDVAADRLRLLARVFEPSSRAFIARAAPRGPGLAIDLGCGPGETTRLLLETLHPGRVLGLDSSASHVGRAAAAHPAIAFARHDVTEAPFPEAPADVIYARFLLSHLPRPEAVVSDWAAQLTAGGRLLLEEVEAIEPHAAVLRRYLEALAAMMAARGQELYSGRALARLRDGEGRRIVSSGSATVAPGGEVVARMFSMNLAAWGPDAVAEGTLSASDLDRLGRDLEQFAADPGPGGPRWTLRQVAIAPGP